MNIYIYIYMYVCICICIYNVYNPHLGLIHLDPPRA